MPILNQGYVRELNLDETFDGARSFDNLALGSISQDITVFANNSGNVSTVVWKKDIINYDIQDNKSFIFDTQILYGSGDPINIIPCIIIENTTWNNNRLTLTFSKPHTLISDSIIKIEKTRFDVGGGNVNGTYEIDAILSPTSIRIVYLEDPGNYIVSNKGYITSDRLQLPAPLSTNINYFVSSSNAINKFDITLEYKERLVSDSVIITGNINTDLLFVRGNTVTTDNLLNITLPSIEDDEYSYIGQSRTFEENFVIVENQLDGANFLRTKKFRTNANNTFDSEISLEGHLKIIDPDSFNNSTFNLSPEFNPKTPGVFIVNPISTLDNVLKIRAFSDNSNPWQSNTSTGDLESLTNQINIGDLKLTTQNVSTGGNGATEGTGSPTLDGIQGIIPSPNTTNFSFTHKLPVEINGEIYYFLIRRA
jgi:hypothetical protein